MLRRAPTTISLSNRDIIEHLEHINQETRHDRKDLPSGKGKDKGLRPATSPALVDIGNVSLGKHCHDKEEQNEIFCTFDLEKVRHVGAAWGRTEGGSKATLSHGSDEGFCDDFPPQRADSGWESRGRQPSVDGFNTAGVYPCSRSEDGEERNPIGSADSSAQLDEPPALRQEDYSDHTSKVLARAFDFGGFVESTAEDSSSFVPEDISTPRNSEVQRLRSRVPLPRSPLFRSQGANSPEKRPTTSLTPRVASYSTPGLLLSQPPRRPRSYRPRTISYSFADSETASTAYEQVGASDDNSTGDQQTHDEQQSFQDDLCGRSSQSPSLASDVPSSPPQWAGRQESHPDSGPSDRSGEVNRRLDFSSPRLPLPPPFSAVPRDRSSRDTIPSSPLGSRSPLPSPFCSPSRSPRKSETTRLQASPAVGPSSASSGDEEISSILHNLAALPLRLLSAYRARSPLPARSEAAGLTVSSPTPRRRSFGRGSPQPSPSTRRRRQLQVYDDQVPASRQPQTPQHLPETRHQSRFFPSYTAPPGAGLGRRGSPRPRMSQASLRRKTRSDSPPGLQTPGFRGLYGGRENSDDEAMFDRASRRLWTLSSVRNHGRSLRSHDDVDADADATNGAARSFAEDGGR